MSYFVSLCLCVWFHLGCVPTLCTQRKNSLLHTCFTVSHQLVHCQKPSRQHAKLVPSLHVFVAVDMLSQIIKVPLFYHHNFLVILIIPSPCCLVQNCVFSSIVMSPPNV